MNDKIKDGVKCIEEGYRPYYFKQIKNIPATFESKLILISPMGDKKIIHFNGMEVSVADSVFYNYLADKDYDYMDFI